MEKRSCPVLQISPKSRQDKDWKKQKESKEKSKKKSKTEQKSKRDSKNQSKRKRNHKRPIMSPKMKEKNVKEEKQNKYSQLPHRHTRVEHARLDIHPELVNTAFRSNVPELLVKGTIMGQLK